MWKCVEQQTVLSHHFAGAWKDTLVSKQVPSFLCDTKSPNIHDSEPDTLIRQSPQPVLFLSVYTTCSDMSSSDLIQINRDWNSQGKVYENITTIEHATFMRFSKIAEACLFEQSLKVFDVCTDAPTSAILHVFDWMKDQAARDPACVMLKPRHEDLEELIWIQQLCRILFILPNTTVSQVRSAAIKLATDTPLTLRLFMMIFEEFGVERKVCGEVEVRGTLRRRVERVERVWRVKEVYCRGGRNTTLIWRV